MLSKNQHSPELDLNSFLHSFENSKPFYFVRFSDGEMEIIHNRFLEISEVGTYFNGKLNDYFYDPLDYKKFDPTVNQNFRGELIESAKYIASNYIKGIPTSHNEQIADRDFLISLNNNSEHNLTFSDLFLNSNYLNFRKGIEKYLDKVENGFVISNFRSNLSGPLKKFQHLKIPDNIFSDYQIYLEDFLQVLENIPPGSVILSSASSFTNIIGTHLHKKRDDIFFIDIGTSLNDYLGLKMNSRLYHCLVDKSFIGRIKAWKYKRTKNFLMKW
jgi:hypothetical protein